MGPCQLFKHVHSAAFAEGLAFQVRLGRPDPPPFFPPKGIVSRDTSEVISSQYTVLISRTLMTNICPCLAAACLGLCAIPGKLDETLSNKTLSISKVVGLLFRRGPF